MLLKILLQLFWKKGTLEYTMELFWRIIEGFKPFDKVLITPPLISTTNECNMRESVQIHTSRNPRSAEIDH